jgi:hypothetical protein
MENTPRLTGLVAVLWDAKYPDRSAKVMLEPRAGSPRRSTVKKVMAKTARTSLKLFMGCLWI